MSIQSGKESTKQSSARSKLITPPNQKVLQEAIELAERLSKLVEKHGPAVFTGSYAPEDNRTSLMVIIDVFIKAAQKNPWVGVTIYRQSLFRLFDGLKKKAMKATSARDQKDLKLLPVLAYEATKLVQEHLDPKIVSEVSRKEIEFPVLMSLVAGACSDYKRFFKEIELGAGLPWRVAIDSKWSTKGHYFKSTAVAQALISEISRELEIKNGKPVPYNKRNEYLYNQILEKTFFDDRKMDDPWFDCLLTGKASYKTRAARRGRIKDLIKNRMEAMLH